MLTKAQTKILVVDDLLDWRVTLGGLLKDEGYQVCVAGSFEETLEKLKADHFDLALLDVRLDERDESNQQGLELATEIRSHFLDTEVVIITGYGTQQMIRQACEPDEGGQSLAADFVPKDDTDRLLETVNRVLTQKP